MRKGEVWLLNLDPTIGAEIRKTRPAVIVSEDAIGILPLRVIVPLTDWKERYFIAPWMISIAPDAQNGLAKLSAADAFQIRSVAQERFVQKIGALNDDQIRQILKAIQIVIGAA
ncbi:MAG: type II toxin-antitoxin system PemK/MazF family toxin [Anaerolineales bacterium]|nr:type II toxin-antitoxin system PemK/MazF family toxin [Anaerolineales bacterium]